MKSDFVSHMEKNFNQVTTAILSEIKQGEDLTLSLAAEKSTFMRFNGSRVRQTTDVHQGDLDFKFIRNERTCQYSIPFSGDEELDISRSRKVLAELRKEVDLLPPDPYVIYPENNGCSSENHRGGLLEDQTVLGELLKPAQQVDLAGVFSSGPVICANLNSKGQRHWFSTENFFIDYSLYSPQQKAVKGCYAGNQWRTGEWEKNLSASKEMLAAMNRPSKKVPRGSYATYLAPAAINEILHLWSWCGVSEGSLRQKDSFLLKLVEGEKSFSPKFSLRENFELGLVPRFNSLGEVAANQLSIIENGKLVNTLVSSRTAKEYGIRANAAEEQENLRSPEIQPGSLCKSDILKKLDCGLYLSNLHYLNYSDKMSARITGMTRFACFWVENGELVAPIEDLRFDESMYNIFGKNLVEFTEFRDMLPNTDTYHARGLGGSLVPGLLVNDFIFSL